MSSSQDNKGRSSTPMRNRNASNQKNNNNNNNNGNRSVPMSGVPYGYLPAFLPGSASLIEQLDHRVMIVLRDGRHLIGVS